MNLHPTYDPEADALYVRLGDAPRTVARTRSVAPGIQFDVDADGKLLGIEILRASTQVHADALTAEGPGEEWLTLVEAGKHAGRSPSTLRVLLHTGKLTGRKVGRDWQIARHVLETYAEAVYWREQRALQREAGLERTSAKRVRTPGKRGRAQ
ncbi:MAG: DUF2283 domain-containing protein [Gemmatimonadaceae bacterium]|nr:DUF2283 domain-containing protein [Gemmatimonadaceae bacterium]